MSAICLKNTDLAALLRVQSLAATLSTADLPRLQQLVLPNSEPVTLKLSFNRVNGVVTVSGTISGTLWMACQRCLEDMPLKIDDKVRIGLVETESMLARVGADYEAIVAAAGEVKLAQLIEDQLLLAIPFSARHPEDKCGPLVEHTPGLAGTETETTTPFAGLGDLLHNRRD